MFRISIIGILLMFVVGRAVAGEGMWIPILLEKYNIEEMRSKGFQLTAEDIFSINQSSMKDAVMVFGGGCTGSMISAEGLLITNHHCGYSVIQSHSSVTHDYLKDGFWAYSKEEELVNPNLQVRILKRMEDVTSRVLDGVSDEMARTHRANLIKRNTDKILMEVTEGTHYTAMVEPFYHGNQYFLFVNEVFRDVRLVGAPPSSIGKYGGDTDNWMWPRHSGDFALFRVYADTNNMPADYSPYNVPYQLKWHFPISTAGVKDGDFTMVFGYPGSTSQYVPSFHLQMLTETVYPALIDLRTAKLNIMNHYMDNDAMVRIQYASKNASLSNTWKRWKGEIRGLGILDTVAVKQLFEADFTRWVEDNPERIRKYGNIINSFGHTYESYIDYRLSRDFFMELIGRRGLETIRFAGSFERLLSMYGSENFTDEQINSEKDKLEREINSHFKDFSLPIDREITAAALRKFRQSVPKQFHGNIFSEIDTKYKGDVDAFMANLFSNTIFTDEAAVRQLNSTMSKRQVRQVQNDPALAFFRQLRDVYYNDVLPEFNRLNQQLDSLNRLYVQGMMAFDSTRVFYPDANFTLRVAYGRVGGYLARDAVQYHYQTTLDGIFEKYATGNPDYIIPQRLHELYQKGDYENYAVNGTVPVCFIATNHTTGGNSGSPVVNGRGELIGVNFDRAWEGVMSDLMFNPEQCRNISVDIRYVLFIIDKFAGASYLLDEMNLVP